VFVDEKQQIDIRGCIDDVPDRFDIVVLALDI
jgi:DNA-directed RNA polymerase subunit K/omega